MLKLELNPNERRDNFKKVKFFEFEIILAGLTNELEFPSFPFSLTDAFSKFGIEAERIILSAILLFDCANSTINVGLELVFGLSSDFTNNNCDGLFDKFSFSIESVFSDFCSARRSLCFSCWFI